MLNHLRWRIVGSCALASAVALGLFAAVLYQTGQLQPTTPEAHATLALIYLLALSVALAISLSASRLLLAPTLASTNAVIRWARSVAGDTQAPVEGPLVEGDLTDLANPVRDLGRVLREEITTLQAERGRLALALDHMENGVVVIDSYHRIVLINPAAARLLRTTPEAAEGRSLVEIARDHELVAVADACLEENSNLGALPPTPRTLPAGARTCRWPKAPAGAGPSGATRTRPSSRTGRRTRSAPGDRTCCGCTWRRACARARTGRWS